MIPFLLLVIGIALIIVNIKAINRKENSFQDVLKYKEENMSDVEMQIGQIRKDVAESLTEMQQEILELKKELQKDNINDKEEAKIHKEIIVNDEDLKGEDFERKVLLDGDEEVINHIDYKDKAQRIKELLESGLTEDEICSKLSIGKGEVLLVKGLFKK